MKKTKLLTFLILVLSVICSSLLITACGKEDTTINPSKLTAPTVTLVGDTATWDANNLADKFEISIDGNLSYIENSVTSRKLIDGQSFKIRAVGDGTKYTNSDWSNSVTYVKEAAKYTITWKNGDSVLEIDENVLENTLPTYNGEEPAKISDAQYSYEFAGWTPEVVKANGDVTYTAVFTPILNKYTVIWKNGEETLETDTAEYGAIPEYNGNQPTKPADSEFMYTFKGWSPAISHTTGDITYVAEFTPVPKGYTIIWKNGDITLETDNDVPYGTAPSYDGDTPTKEATAQYTFTFSGWSPAISNVTESVTYEAQFTSSTRSYTVTFYSEDGLTVLDSVTVDYGQAAVYTKEYPVKNATEASTYIFEKWVSDKGGNITDDLTNVIADRSVYAAFKEFTRTVTVYIVSNNTDYGTVSASVFNGVPYGSKIEVSGNTVTIDGKTVTAVPSNASAQYTYTFTSWTTDSTVGNDTTVVANFSRTINTYTVTWKNGNDILETDTNVPYGAMPVYNGAQPTKPSDSESIYTFSGWSPAISTVVSDATYIAEFTNASNKHIVTFYSDDGVTELGRAIVGHGQTAVYPYALPTKEPSAQVTYTFAKWISEMGGEVEADLTNITENKSVYAKFLESARTYTVTFCNYDGAVLDSIAVEYKKSAVESIPILPPRESCYRFDGWIDTATESAANLSSITRDMSVKATYTKLYLVQFLDHDDTILPINYCENCKQAYKYSQLMDSKCPSCEKEISIIYDQWIELGESAIAPENPVRDGHRFTGWNTGFTNIADNLTVKAQYIEQYNVTFIGFNGEILKECLVDKGTSATSPTDDEASKTGYTFVGWDRAFTNISSDLIVTAIYEIKTYSVKFVLPDGTIIGEDTVEYGFSAIEPAYPPVFLTGTGINSNVYGFTGWDTAFDRVEGDLTVKAIYDTVYTNPVIIVNFDGASNQTATVYIYSHNTVTINGIELGINYKTETGKIVIDSVSFVSDGLFSQNYEQVINNNEMKYTYAWSNASGAEKYDGLAVAMTFKLQITVGGITIGEKTFVIDSCNLVISDENGESPEKITPVVVYR